MSIDIVIAHYKENIDWINHESLNGSSIKNIYLYTKNSDYELSTLLKNNKKIIHQYLPNLGRESHTYLTYCIDHYENKVDTVFFLQGNPFVHNVDINRLSHWIKHSNNTVNFFSKNFTNSFLLKGLTKNGHIKYWQGNTEPCELDIGRWFIKNIQNTIPKPVKIYYGANFCIPKSKILLRHKDYYKSILNENLLTPNPESGHFFERSWFYLFNLHI